MGKKGDLSPCKKAEVNALVNAKLFSNREISRRLKVSEASVRRIKKKIKSGKELSPKRKKNCGRKSIFTPSASNNLARDCKSLDSIQSEGRMMVGNLTESLSLIEKELRVL
ncbi:hypothetical protein TNCV_3178021 [Trichonephila clavipes]|nr:hypothetical protein TNCV_3178021 [Trichonephila clavipes]